MVSQNFENVEAMSFIDALNNSTTRSIIDQIEELQPTPECAILADIRINLIAELEQLGYDWKD